MRQRVIYFAILLLAILLGLASRRYRELLPLLLGQYGGDVLWAIMLYFLIAMCWPRLSPFRRAWIALGIAYLVEFSQLYQAPWINRIRKSTFGGLVLGVGFLWSDLVCYAVGVAIGLAGDWGIQRMIVVSRSRLKPSNE